jgi:ribose transport system ATP-binding protein/rhamnose transport system ATP-binding protein
MRSHPEISVLAGVIVGGSSGILCGLINGLVVTAVRVLAIVVTLGALAVFRGVDSLLTGGKQISADQVPQAWLDMTGARIAGIPAVVIIAIITLTLMQVALRAFAIGREFYAAGSNPDGAALGH